MNVLRLPFLYLVLAWISALIGLVLGLMIESHWFSRCGSIVVLLAIMSEYSLLKQEFGNLYKKLAQDSTKKELSPSVWQQKKSLAGHVTVVIGTFIWGFGDLILP